MAAPPAKRKKTAAPPAKRSWSSWDRGVGFLAWGSLFVDRFSWDRCRLELAVFCWLLSRDSREGVGGTSDARDAGSRGCCPIRQVGGNRRTVAV